MKVEAAGFAWRYAKNLKADSLNVGSLSLMPRPPCSVHMFFTVNRKPQPIPEKDNVQGFRVYGPVPDVGIIRRARLNCTAPAKEQTSEFLNVLFYLTNQRRLACICGATAGRKPKLAKP